MPLAVFLIEPDKVTLLGHPGAQTGQRFNHLIACLQVPLDGGPQQRQQRISVSVLGLGLEDPNQRRPMTTGVWAPIDIAMFEGSPGTQGAKLCQQARQRQVTFSSKNEACHQIMGFVIWR